MFLLSHSPPAFDIPLLDCGVYCATRDQQKYQSRPQPQGQTAPTLNSYLYYSPVTPATAPSYQRAHHSSTTQHPAHDPLSHIEHGSTTVNRVSYEPEDTRIDPNVLKRLPILFYHRTEPHFGFTNFSSHPVEYNGRRYPTSEHLFQAFKVRLSPCGLISYMYEEGSADRGWALMHSS